MTLFKDVQFTSDLLKEIAFIDSEKGFPDLTDLLKFYQVILCFTIPSAKLQIVGGI